MSSQTASWLHPLALRPERRGRLPVRTSARRLLAATPGPRVAAAGAGALLAVEICLSALLWGPIPYAWLWVGGRAYRVTGSLLADGSVALLGFALTIAVTMRTLNRLDSVWVAWRRHAGHEQKEGALTRVVVASATLGLLAFALWYYLGSKAYIIPFMPSR